MSPEKMNLVITEDYQVYPPKPQGAYPVHENDWERIKRMVRAIVPEDSSFQTGSGIFFGIFVTALFTIIGFSASKDVPEWARITAWVGLSLGLAMAGVLYYLGGKQKKTVTLSSQNVIEEMERLEKEYDKSPPISIARPNASVPIGGALGKGVIGRPNPPTA